MKTKIYLFSIAVLCTSATMFAQPITKENSQQVKQDVVMVGGSIGNLRVNFQNNANQVQFQLTPRIGWMFRDRFMAGLFADFDFQAVENAQTTVRYSAGLFARAYTGRGGAEGYSKTRLFGEFSSGFAGYNSKLADKTKPDVSINGLAIGFGAGLAYFPAPNLGIELLPRFLFNTGAGSSQSRASFSITFGANMYLPRARAKEMAKDM